MLASFRRWLDLQLFWLAAGLFDLLVVRRRFRAGPLYASSEEAFAYAAFRTYLILEEWQPPSIEAVDPNRSEERWGRDV